MRTGILLPERGLAGAQESASHLSRAYRHPALAAWTLFLVLTGFFYLTTPKHSASSDPLLNTISAWTLATNGELVLDGHETRR